MTSHDLELEAAPLGAQPLVVYRLAKSKYANLSGTGSAIVPGRWNLPDQKAIYTSAEAGTTVLEKLVHTPKSVIPDDLALMEILIIADWELTDETLLVDRNTSGWIQVYKSLRMASVGFDSFRRNGHHSRQRQVPKDQPPFAVAVPSVVAPAWNIVLYPDAPGFRGHIQLRKVNPFVFDERLFPPNTPRGL